MIKKYLFIFLLLLLLATPYQGFAQIQIPDGCSEKLHQLNQYFSGSGAIKPEQMQEFKIMPYNMLDFIENVGAPRKDSGASRPQKNLSKIIQEAKIILENHPDIVVGVEVDSIEHMDKVSNAYMNGEYKALLIKSNDERGISIGFWIKENLPFKFELRSNKFELWQDPVEKEKGLQPVLARDLPMLYVRPLNAPDDSKPVMIIVGVHFKSKRDRAHDPQSMIWKISEAKRAGQLIEQVQQRNPDTVIIAAGDFNTNVDSDPILNPIKNSLVDTFDVAPHPPTGDQRVTHTFHPNEGPMEKAEMDAVLISKNAGDLVIDSRAVPYKDLQGHERPLPKTYEERSTQPSDHRPVLTTLSFQKMWQRFINNTAASK